MPNPVTFEGEATGLAEVEILADAWSLGTVVGPSGAFELTYTFTGVGVPREIVALGRDAAGATVATDTLTITVDPGAPASGDAAGHWSWLTGVDHALRSDGLGGGHFGAPRSGNAGGHSGIDVLAPVGTAVTAPCAGGVLAGWAYGYGYYVQLICQLPGALGEGSPLWASMLFAHLDSLAVANGATVAEGQTIATVGKTGNANSAGIHAHVHLEIAIHASEGAAWSELHVSTDHSSNGATWTFVSRIEEACWDPLDLERKTGPAMKGRRVDPYLLLACLTTDKPAMSAPPSWLQAALEPWSAHYSASGFDVNAGP